MYVKITLGIKRGSEYLPNKYTLKPLVQMQFPQITLLLNYFNYPSLKTFFSGNKKDISDKVNN